ncbi:hypothetical protein DYH09_01385 [bacterium CPR1]|nr:hypothetical protein [bacterium CPR1]
MSRIIAWLSGLIKVFSGPWTRMACMQIRPLAAGPPPFPCPPLAASQNPVDSYSPGPPAAPALSQVLKPITNTQVELYRAQLPAATVAAPAVGPDGSLYCVHEQGLTILGPDGVEKGSFFLRDGSPKSPVVRPDGSVLLTSRHGLHCVDATGHELFFRELGKPGVAPALGPQGQIYFGEHTGHLHCLDERGNPLWVFETERQKRDGGWSGHINGEMAVGPDGTVLLNAEGVVHVVGPDGKLRFKLLEDEKGRNLSVSTGPAFASDGSILVSRQTNRVECYESHGKLRWSQSLQDPAQAFLGNRANTTPRSLGELVVVGAGSGELSALDLATGVPRWQLDLGASMAGDRVQVGPENTLYAAGQYSSDAHCVSPEGEKLWSFHFPQKADRASMASAGDRVFMVSQQGQVHALRSDTIRQQLAALPPGEDQSRNGIQLSERAAIVGGVRVRRKGHEE